MCDRETTLSPEPEERPAAIPNRLNNANAGECAEIWFCAAELTTLPFQTQALTESCAIFSAFQHRLATPRAIYFLLEDFLLELFFFVLFFFGTFAPALRASDKPMAMACLRLVTFFLLRPLFSFPFFIACISRSTDFDAAFPYLRELDFFFVGMAHTSRKWEAIKVMQVVRLLRYCCRGENIFHVYPFRRIIAGVTGNAKVIAFAAVTCLL